MDTSISAISSFAGQMLIPIPVLGTIIGNVSGEIIYGICKDKCSRYELQLIQEQREKIEAHKTFLEREYSYYMKAIDNELSRFQTIEELVFDEDLNTACNYSIRLAQITGVPEEQILHNEQDLYHFLTD